MLKSGRLPARTCLLIDSRPGLVNRLSNWQESIGVSLEQVVTKLVADAKALEPFALDMRGIGNDELVVDLDKRA